MRERDPGPWKRDPSIAELRKGGLVSQRQERVWPGGGVEDREVVRVQQEDGSVKVFVRTVTNPNYKEADEDNFLSGT